ncbi:MAG: hypothetical protein AW07_04134 [Candidatus Accumulibacter sp. SK-11]|nr:MAG: hypothetical protein AW07_04134 [Candidatus Accumulibacter sp. SK-11]
MQKTKRARQSTLTSIGTGMPTSARTWSRAMKAIGSAIRKPRR